MTALIRAVFLLVVVASIAPQPVLCKEQPQCREQPQAVRVYFFTGGPLDIFCRHACRTIQKKLKNHSAELNIPVSFSRKWFRSWRDVCDQVIANKGRDKVVLIGHSWGGASAVQAASYLNDHNTAVDLLITIDSTPVRGFVPREIIPANVRVHYNFFQDSDIVAHGCCKTRRANAVSGSPEDQSIHNVQVLMGRTLSPHLGIDQKISGLNAGQVRLVMLNRLDRLQLPDRLDGAMIENASAVLESTVD